MKQQITKEQLKELTDKQRRELGQWALRKDDIKWEDRGAQYPLLSISQLIEFLYQNVTVVIESEERESPIGGWIVSKQYHSIELIDALWKKVKEILKK